MDPPLDNESIIDEEIDEDLGDLLDDDSDLPDLEEDADLDELL